MLTRQQIADANYGQLLSYRNDMVVAKMKLDKFFSVFLDEYDLPEDDTMTPEWVTYREMLKQYGLTDSLKRQIDYRISHA